MRFVQRPDTPPEALSAPEVHQLRKSFLEYLHLEPVRRAQTVPPSRQLPNSLDVASALANLFHDRCAFCERSGTPLNPYCFRPTSDAQPDLESNDALFTYGWLADIWQNLYPICEACLPSFPNLFPVVGKRRVPCPSPEEYKVIVDANTGLWETYPSTALNRLNSFVEEPILLDPCFDHELELHLLAMEDGQLKPLTERGMFTIQQFDLNRAALVKQRGDTVTLRQTNLSAVTDQFLSRMNDGAPKSLALIDELPDHMAFRGFCALLILSRIRRSLGMPDPDIYEGDTPHTDAFRERRTKVRWFLSSVEISNFKSIQSMRMDLLPPNTNNQLETIVPDEAARRANRTPAVLLLGENATGKSSILEAIALAMLDHDAQMETGQKVESLLLDPRYLGGDGKAANEGFVELTFASDTGETSSRKLTISGERGFLNNSEGPFQGMPVFAYGAFRHFLDGVTEWDSEARGVISLFRTDNLLSNPNRWLFDLNQNQFHRVIAALRAVFGSNSSFLRIEKRRDLGDCVVVTNQNEHEAYTPLDAVSSGFRSILSLMCDVTRWIMERPGFTTLQNARAVVLIDEVEAHLHPRWKLQVMDGLREALPNVTFIATSHDPLCLRGMNDGEVKVLARAPVSGDGPAVRVKELQDLPNVSKLTIEQLLTSDFFRLFDIDDPLTTSSMLALTDLLIRNEVHQQKGLSPVDRSPLTVPESRLLDAFRSEVNGALPIGRSDVARLVQDAVVKYLLALRRSPDISKLKLRTETVDRIVQLLRET